MAINRYDGNLEAFAQNAQSGERTVYGSKTVSDSLDDNINDDFKRGWGIVSDNDAPTMEDYNGAMFTHGQLLAYLHQIGIAEWNGAQVYAENGFVNYDGAIYRCKTADHSGVSTPDSDSTNWQLIMGANGFSQLVAKDSGTGGAFMPAGTTGQRPSANPVGDYSYLRFNSDSGGFEFSSNGSIWYPLFSEKNITTPEGAQELIDNSTLITPLRLGQAFVGINASFGDPGFQKLPSGLILQWGSTVQIPSGSRITQNYPVTYTTANLLNLVTRRTTVLSTDLSSYAVSSPTLSGVDITNGSATAETAYWFSIGY